MTDSRSKPGRRWMFWSVLVALPLGAALAGLAVFGVLTTRQYMDTGVELVGDNDLRFDPVIGFVRTPDATTRRVQDGGIDYTIHSDSRGARVNAAGQQTPPRVAILTVGCSFSEGHGFANEHSYTERLGRAFAVPVANVAVGSYSGVQSWLSLERHAGLKPKVIVYGLIEDHLRRNLDPCAPNFFPVCLQVPVMRDLDAGTPSVAPVPDRALAAGDLTFELLSLRSHPSLLRRAWLGLRIVRQRWLERTVRAGTGSAQTPQNQYTAESMVINSMAATARRLDAKLVILYMGRVDGGASDADGWRPLPASLRAAIPADVAFVDTTAAVQAALRAHPDQPLHLSATDDHPNARAHALFAQLLAERIAAGGWLAPGPAPGVAP